MPFPEPDRLSGSVQILSKIYKDINIQKTYLIYL